MRIKKNHLFITFHHNVFWTYFISIWVCIVYFQIPKYLNYLINIPCLNKPKIQFSFSFFFFPLLHCLLFNNANMLIPSWLKELTSSHQVKEVVRNLWLRFQRFFLSQTHYHSKNVSKKLYVTSFFYEKLWIKYRVSIYIGRLNYQKFKRNFIKKF